MQVSLPVAAILAVVALTSCAILPDGRQDVLAVWDLRDTRSVEAVGWPEEMGGAQP